MSKEVSKELALIPIGVKPMPSANALPELGCIDRLHIGGYLLDEYRLAFPESYTILCETSKYCKSLEFYPKADMIIISDGKCSYSFTKDFPQKFVPDLAEKLGVTEEAAFDKSVQFFQDKSVKVLPHGIQGYTYKFMAKAQNAVPAVYTFDAVTAIKSTGVTGFEIIKASPLTFVGATYLTGVVCGYFGGVAGNTPVGTIFNATSYILTRPMWGVELVLNGLVLRPISHLTGLPMTLNATDELMSGKGIKFTEFAKINAAFEKIGNKTAKLTKAAKEIAQVFKNNFGK